MTTMPTNWPISFEQHEIPCSGILTKSAGGVRVVVHPDQSKEEIAVALWHEIIHLIRNSAGSRMEGSEEEEFVEKHARQLAAACPQITEWCFPHSRP